ncbi:drug/metabolite transporter (DMT)-like permease [Pararhizobium capsulatum DSM 1112]|uniref:Drug/metabolite transporter (DMT)-like permease n=1 Tax=Pararhizobium capsulatum DSM 1112 TaxID=1121113 RepID=A0ABU0BWB1_9HYPH|nr:DMT family transporter [Pararhizobium capsulatum]MDQ0322238.1 drug/metabolite transporter (DMT)-like permease [Pararhizobium capsulatum DSM 1112]
MSQTELAVTAPAARSRLALIALLAGAVAIGASPIFVRLSEVGPMATAFWRVALAVVPLFFLFRAAERGDAAKPQGLREMMVLALPGVFLAGDLISWHASIHVTTVANATLLANLAPVFVTAIGWVFFGASITRAFLIGLFVAIVGIVVLKGGLSGLAEGNRAGDLLAILAAVFYAGYMLSIARLRGRFDTMRVMLWSTLSAAVCLLPVVLLTESQLFPVTIFGWAMLIGLALICHVGGQVAIAYALAYLPTAFSSLTLLLQPVVAALLGVVVLGEGVSVTQAIGGAIVLCGILYARRK